MIITRKAAVGFILLAAIVFLTVYYTPTPAQMEQSTGAVEHPTILQQTKEPIVKYQLPLITFKERWQAPLAATVVMELFTLICYIALKKLEPAINRVAEEHMRDLRELNESEPEKNE